MNDQDRRCLSSCLEHIVQDLIPDEIFPYLIQEGIFMEDDIDVIKHEVTRTQQNMKFVSLLKTKGPKAFNVFCESLKSSHFHLYQMLESNGIAQPKDNAVLNKIKTELKTQYSHSLSSLSPIPWCEWFQLSLKNVYTNLKLVRGVQRKAFESTIAEKELKTAAEDLFKAHQECSSPKHILIEGDAGIGKSTLCSKLVYDWTSDDADPKESQSIQSYDLIFVLEANDFCNPEIKSVVDVIYSKLLAEDFSVDKASVQSCIEDTRHKILFIVDSYDEADVQKCNLLHKLFRRNILSHCHVLVCSRKSYMLHQMKHFDSLYCVAGYDDVQKEDFVHKFAEEVNIPFSKFEILLERLRTDRAVKEISRNPLNLSILCLLCTEENETFPNTRTALYEEMHSFLIKKYQCRCDEDTEEAIQSYLYELSFSALQKGSCTFSEEELTKRGCTIDSLSHIGFLTKKVTISRLKQKTLYEFTHRSFQEFFSAKYMCQLGLKQRNETLRDILGLRTFRSSCRFLFGLMQNDEDGLIDFATIWYEQAQYSPSDDMDFRTLSIFEVTECHKGHLLMQSLCELENIPKGLVKVLDQNFPKQVCFSFPLCTISCVEGLLKVCNILNKECSSPNPDCNQTISVVIPAYCLDLKPDVFSCMFERLTQCKCVQSIGIFNIADLSQLERAFNICKVGHPRSTVKCMKMKFLGIVHGATDAFPMKGLGEFAEGVEIYQCSSPTVMDKIVGAIPEGQNMKSIMIVSSNLGPDGCRTLANKVELCPRLERFCLTDHSLNATSPDEFICILEKLSYLKSLVHIKLSNFPSGAKGSEHALLYLKDILTQNELKELSLFNTAYSEPVCATLKSTLTTMHTLEKLIIDGGLLTDHKAFDEVLAQLTLLPRLQTFGLQGLEIAESHLELIEQLLISTSTLKKLSVCKVNCNLIHIISRGLRGNKTVKVLRLRKLGFSGEYVVQFAETIQGHPALESLYLTMHPGNYLVDEEIINLLQAFGKCDRLKRLALRHFGIENHLVKHICEMLGNNSHIFYLDLCHNKFNEHALDTVEAYLAIKQRKLQYLDISDCYVTEACPQVDLLRKQCCFLRINWF